MSWVEGNFAWITRRIPYEALSRERVSRAMVGMVNTTCQTPYPLDELRRIWRTDLAGRQIDPVTLAPVLT